MSSNEAKGTLVDEMFHAWLISNDMGSDEQGTIHYRTKAGVLTEIVPPETFHQLIEDPEKGLVAKVHQLAPDLDFTLFWSPPDLREEAQQLPDELEAEAPKGSAR